MWLNIASVIPYEYRHLSLNSPKNKLFLNNVHLWQAGFFWKFENKIVNLTAPSRFRFQPASHIFGAQNDGN
jgi:hypothetical protein